MSKTKINVVGIGCDFQNEADESRKLAIENLSGGEKERISWMTKFMAHNKAFKYTSNNKSEKEKQNLLNELNNTYIQYRKNWKNQPIESFKNNLHGKILERKIIIHCVLILKWHQSAI